MPDSEEIKYAFKLAGLQEHVVWAEKIRPQVQDLPDNILRILEYGFSEMLNNAIDHSEGTTVAVWIQRSSEEVKIWIMDDGIGIFNKIKKVLNLEDPHDAILELSKGKFTTDPEHHTGEGIFFTSRACDSFFILSDIIRFGRFQNADWLVKQEELPNKGTSVIMEVNYKTKRTLNQVFDEFASEHEEYGFTRTRVPIALGQYGPDGLMSRSKARRVLNRFSRFKEVILDFVNVDFIGPAFADEIFRVYAKSHPDVHILWVNANESIQKMIQKALQSANSKSPADDIES